jgi:hypothetical protein
MSQPGKPTEQDIERAKEWYYRPGHWLDSERITHLAAKFAAVREEARVDYQTLLDAHVEEIKRSQHAESRGYLAGLDAAYRQTEGTCNCGANICAEIERVKVLPVTEPPVDPPAPPSPPKGSQPPQP